MYVGCFYLTYTSFGLFSTLHQHQPSEDHGSGFFLSTKIAYNVLVNNSSKCLMDYDNLVTGDGFESADENGVRDNSVAGGENGAIFHDVNGYVDKTTYSLSPSANSGSNSLLVDVGPYENIKGESDLTNGLIFCEEGQMKDADNSKLSKAQIAQAMSKINKPPGAKVISSSRVKKVKDAQIEEERATVSEDSGGSNSRLSQSVKSKSFNDRQSHVPKKSGKSSSPSSEGIVEKPKLKTLRKGSGIEAEGDTQSTLSPQSVDNKPHKIAALPNYGFSFKCDERAARRKEFYTKLEEKSHAKEEEKSSLQAKSKETQEAEIKMLRKKLAFKATPMPSFYQEPGPPKTDLKKVPPTRAKSPKLGRKKILSSVDNDGYIIQASQVGRLSLDEKVAQSIPSKVTSIVTPQRKSLPRLPSEKTSLSNVKNERKTVSVKTNTSTSVKRTVERNSTSSKTIDEGKASLSNTKNEAATSNQEQEQVPVGHPSEHDQVVTTIEPSEGEHHIDEEEDIMVEEQEAEPRGTESVLFEH